MSDFKVKLKLSIKNLFKKFGFQVSRLPYQGKSSNELVKVKVGDFHIQLNGSHQLPQYMRNPNYSTNLPRLAVKVKEKYPDLAMLDVGANIGDTVAFVRSKSYFPIACIEGDARFFEILKMNLANFKDVQAFRCVLGETSGMVNASLEKNAGSLETARIHNAANFGKEGMLNVITLDSFLETDSRFKTSKLLKIDTDGYDLKIIRGGLDYIKQTKPVLFFEYDTVFLAEQKDDGISTLRMLENLGYKDMMFYDNSGKFILSAELSNHLLVDQMNNLIDKNYRTPFPFYDIVLFHAEDGDIAETFIRDEMRFFYKR